MPKDLEDNIAWREFIWTAAEDPEIREEIKIICSRDMLFEINTFGWVMNPRDHRDCPDQPFITYGFQDDMLKELEACIGNCDVAFPKSRQMGCSECCVHAMEHSWRWMSNQEFLLTSKVEELVDSKAGKALFSKLRYHWDHLPAWLMPANWVSVKKAATNHDNGSRFTGQATVPDIGRGSTVTAILCDETAEQDNAEMIASATQSATNCRIYNSTPNGRFGTGAYFYSLMTNSSVRKIWVHWSEHPDRRAGLYKMRRKVVDPGTSDLDVGQFVSERVFEQTQQQHGDTAVFTDPVKMSLNAKTYSWRDDYDFIRCRFRDDEKPRSDWYDYQCERSKKPKNIAKELDLDFEGSARHFIEGDILEQARINQCQSPMHRGEVLYDALSMQEGLPYLRPIWVPGGGHLELWTPLITKRPPRGSYSVGADISGGTGGEFSSQSAMVVFDNKTGKQVAEWKSSHYPPEEFAIKFVCLCKWFWDAFGVPEINGPGGTNFIKKVKECGYFHVYRRKGDESEAAATVTSKLGFFSRQGPTETLGPLIESISNSESTIRSEVIISQLLEYEWSGGKVVHKSSSANDDEADKGKAHGDVAIAAGMGWIGVVEMGLLNLEEESPHPELFFKRDVTLVAEEMFAARFAPKTGDDGDPFSWD